MIRIISTTCLVIDKIMQSISALAIIAVMAIVFADVVLRYWFKSPLPWSYDLISLYLMPGIFLFSLSWSYARGAHVRITLFIAQLSDGARNVVFALTTLAALIIFSSMVVAGVIQTYDAWAANELLALAIAWPTWVYQALIPIGIGALAIRLLLDLLLTISGRRP